MKTSLLKEIENKFDELSLHEQLTLIERLLHRSRGSVLTKKRAWESDLAAMAADPDIQRELREIDQEFRVTEGDGLE